MREQFKIRLVEFAGGWTAMQVGECPMEWRGKIVDVIDVSLVMRDYPQIISAVRTKEAAVKRLSEFVAHMDGVKSEVGETCQKCGRWSLIGNNTIECRSGDSIPVGACGIIATSAVDVLRSGWPPVPDFCPKRGAKSTAPVVDGDVYTW